MSAVVTEILGSMDVQRLSIAPQNQEENGIEERYNGAIMNVVRKALKKVQMDWYYWPWALAEDNDKYKNLPHAGTGKTLQE